MNKSLRASLRVGIHLLVLKSDGSGGARGFALSAADALGPVDVFHNIHYKGQLREERRVRGSNAARKNIPAGR